MKAIFFILVISFFSAVQWVSNIALPPLPPSTAQQTASVSISTTDTTETSPTSKKSEQNTAASSLVPKQLPAASTQQPHPSNKFPEQTTPPTPITLSVETEKDFLTKVEIEIFLLTNKERTALGLPSLVTDTELAAIAEAHSKDMLMNDYFSHEDKSGCSSSCRANNRGYSWSTIGENIYMMSGYELSATEAAAMIVQGWMNSPGHRANILRPAFTHLGVGVVAEGKNVYSTALFAKPR
ncbi:MAG: hypothetical protein G01um10148_623 [Parcubacteria group bacterium Gr01-1014_8]|nr:MAG: hypothetical protein G01um10148_623 [Parcubacteria group bacterium Gr01-1014_8]